MQRSCQIGGRRSSERGAVSRRSQGAGPLRRTAVTTAVAAVMCVLPVMTTGAAAQTEPTLRSAAPAGPEAVPGEIVVGFRAGVDGSERAAARSAADVRAERSLLVRGAQLVRVETGQTVDEAITALERRPDVRYAEPNWIRHADATTPNDPLFGQLWGLHNTGQAVNGGAAGTADADIDAPEAWDLNRGSASTVVAVVDSGVAYDHPDLAPNIWINPGEVAGNGVDDDGNGFVDDVRGWDFADDDNDPGTTTTTARTSPARSRRAATTAWASRAWPGRRRSCRSACSAPSARAALPTSRTRSRTRGTTARRSSTDRSAAPPSRRRRPTRSPITRTRCSSSPPATTGRTTTSRPSIRAPTRRPT